MAEGGFFARLFGMNKDVDLESNNEVRTEESAENNPIESTGGTTLQDTVNFIAELQSYYYNDICKMQSDLLLQEESLPETKVNFINKKIKQDQVALSQIDEILELVRNNERDFQEVWRKSIYSFYDEIEKVKLGKVQEKVFSIVLKLCAINTKEELKDVIRNRIELYKNDWNISSNTQIPKNYNIIAVEENDGIEKYRIGEYYKEVYTGENDAVLTSEQIKKLREVSFEFEKRITTNTVWVYVSTVTRLELNFMRRTCFIKNKWEYSPETGESLSFDIVKTEDLEGYLKGILQIAFSKGRYAVVSIVIPTEDMLQTIGKTEQIGEKIKICKEYHFILGERSGIYKENLMTTRIDKRRIPDVLKFLSYTEFRKNYF